MQTGSRSVWYCEKEVLSVERVVREELAGSGLEGR